MTTPTHHTRYRSAWRLYQDPYISDWAKSALEKEMDSAQNEFSWDEFQAFKKTLPGYVAHWQRLAAGLLAVAV